ncbi:MAG: hypothetical protein IJI35_16550 [Kiritimatiellae bacterium]|nr:hypothetical protein [Kiritimatiellia bacterium]MBQ6330631.1 hypothetical protein [Kiritimatiellia bacterium]
MRPAIAVAVASIGVAANALAALQLGAPFTDRAVLQRGMRAPVWGTAEPGAAVTVTFAGQTKTCHAGADGAWRVDLDPMEASAEGRDIVATARGGGGESSAAARDVLVGEVWLACGQSNMECPIWGANPRFRDRKGAMMCAMANQPLVRYVKTPLAWSAKPKRDVCVRWRPMTAASLAATEKPSAVGFYYARELHLALGVPIGIVDSTWGGTPIDAWTPREGYADCDESIRKFAEYKVSESFDKSTGVLRPVIYGAPHQPTALFNGMVAAYAPMAIRGFIWYQGCNNSKEPELYCAKMHALYNGWKRAFANEGLRMYFAQLAPFMTNWPGICAAQAKFAAEEPNASMAVLADVGNFDDVHPNEKETVAQRLALHALKRDYGFPITEDDSPSFRSAVFTNGVATLSFDHVKAWYVYSPDKSLDAPFELCGADGVWHPAKVVNLRQNRVDGKRVDVFHVDSPDLVVQGDSVPEPAGVRYMHRPRTAGTLYNEMSLPLGCFSTKGSKMR